MGEGVRVFFFLLFFWSPCLWGQYRVFELEITDSKTQVSRRVQSSLGPRQYNTYYPLKPQESIKSLDHWMCWRRSDFFKPPCPNPRGHQDDKKKTQNPEKLKKYLP